MAYPNAFCVKCGTKTDTLNKHTVVLTNSSRALRGVCPSCESDVYKILPKGQDFTDKVPATPEILKKYPDAFCVKCQDHTETLNPHTVILENSSRALTGCCKKCGSEVYRLLGQDQGISSPMAKVVPILSGVPRPLAKTSKQGADESMRKKPKAQRFERRSSSAGQGTKKSGTALWLGIGFVTGTVLVFVMYAMIF